MLFVFYIFASVPSHAEEDYAIKNFEETLAISTVISDSDVLTVGFANIELDYIIDLEDDNWGNDETVEFKKNLDALVVPYTYELEKIEEGWEQLLLFRLFYLQIAQNRIFGEGETSFDGERMFGSYIGYKQHYKFKENWYFEPAIGTHLSYYENKFKYSDNIIKNALPFLSENLFNSSVTVLMFEPTLSFGYTEPEAWGEWSLRNSNNYLYGRGLGGSMSSYDKVAPEGWRVSNGVEVKFWVDAIWGISDFISVDLNRVDIGGDFSSVSDSGYYYEGSIGWIIDTGGWVPFLDNVGIGVTVNYGSFLSGGTLVLYYNE